VCLLQQRVFDMHFHTFCVIRHYLRSWKITRYVVTACFSPSVRVCNLTPPTKYLSDFRENFYRNYFKKFSMKCEFYKWVQWCHTLLTDVNKFPSTLSRFISQCMYGSVQEICT
jgi:hypothetical protein